MNSSFFLILLISSLNCLADTRFFMKSDGPPGETQACFGEMLNSSTHVCSKVMPDTPSIQKSSNILKGASHLGLFDKDSVPEKDFEYSVFASKTMPRICKASSTKVETLKRELAMAEIVQQGSCDMSGATSGGSKVRQ